MQSGPDSIKPPKGFDLIYNIPWEKGKNRLPLELACYRTNRQAEQGGLGALRHFKNAWGIIWPKFEWNDWTRLMVEAWCGFSRISVMGHAAAGKTYTLAHIAYLDWLAEPFQTMTSLATVTAEGLRLRMWGDLMRAHEALPVEIKQMLKVYSTPNRMNIMLEGEGKDLEKYIIEGMSVARSKDSIGRIRGKHAPRRRVILDEADDMPAAAYEAIGNIMTDPDVKIIDMSNAVDRYSQFGRACEPRNGWGSVDDTDLFWHTKAGICVHLDGLQNPNYKTYRPGEPAKFPYMLDAVRIESIRREFGEESVEWACMVRGFFPKDGIIQKMWPASAIEKARPGAIWDFPTEPCATLDPAFEHDDCVIHFGEMGLTRDHRKKINALLSIRISPKDSLDEPKDYQVAMEVIRLCKERGVAPHNFIMDKSGAGRGCYAILQKEWSVDVQGIVYGGEATERMLRYGYDEKANQVVKYFVTELWIRARYLAEEGCLCGLGNLDQKTVDDLNARRYKKKQFTEGELMVAESKIDLKKRLGRSPDYGDAFVQFGELLAREQVAVKKEEETVIPSQRWKRALERAKKVNRIYGETIEVQAW
jgi:hypothetical protein